MAALRVGCKQLAREWFPFGPGLVSHAPLTASTPISTAANTTWLVTNCPANQLPNISIHFLSGTRGVGGEGLAEIGPNSKSALCPSERWSAKPRRSDCQGGKGGEEGVLLK